MGNSNWETAARDQWWTLKDYLFYLFEYADWKGDDFQRIMRVYGRAKVESLYHEFLETKNQVK